METTAIWVVIPCPEKRKQKITTGSKAAIGLKAMNKQDAAKITKTIGPIRLTRIISVKPPAQTITIADAKVPKP